VRVKVTDSCPECAAGHLDLSRTAFKKIGNEVDGIIPITYKTVTGVTTPGPISVRVKEGSSQYWLGRAHRQPRQPAQVGHGQRQGHPPRGLQLLGHRRRRGQGTFHDQNP
jgi:expansin (peptidoglycan-binding protein)